jgi:ATP-dependent RNA helicase SUPV3L1/SUV3
VVPEAAAIADEGVAPVAETGSDATAEEPVPEVAENETPVGEAADTSVEAPEVEVFYTFTWGGRARQGGNRGQRRGQQGQDTRGNAGGGKGKPRGAKGGAGGGKPGGKKGGRPQQQGGKTYSARPPKKEKKIDPDNPFAAALMGLKQGD